MENRLELFEKTYKAIVAAWEDVNHDALTMNTHEYEYSMIGGFTNIGLYIVFADYSIDEVNRVDKVMGFRNPNIFWDGTGDHLTSPKGQYLCLCAVMEVLWEIHGIQDRSLTTLNAVASDKGVTVNA